MKIVTRLAGVAVAVLAGCIAAVPANAAPVPVHPVDHVVCFAHAEGPFKNGPGSMAPIGFGFKVHCTPHDPDVRLIHVKLWRKDLATGVQHLHSEHLDSSTTAQIDRKYYASCSNASIQYEFHTQINVDVWYGKWDHASDNSDPVLATC